MQRILLEMPAAAYDDVIAALMPDKSAVEHAAFVFAAVQDGRLRYVEHQCLHPDDYVEQHAGGFELADEVRARVIKRAHDLGAAIIEFHSHLGPWPAAFSDVDREGFKDFVPHVWWRLKGRPYAAVVVASSGLDAVAWTTDPRTPQPLDALVVEGRPVPLTHLSISRWRAEGARFDRNVRLFGKDGQSRIGRARVTVVGAGGLGSAVIQEISHLGVYQQAHVDDQELKRSGLNRYIGSRHDDPIPGTAKVAIARRLATSIDRDIAVKSVNKPLTTEEALDAVINSDFVFGCVDNDGSRLILTEVCAAYAIPYIDLASDVLPGNPTIYGGHVCVAWDGNGCPACMDLIDIDRAQREIAGVELQKNWDAIYGVNRSLLGAAGPSIVSINGVIASLGVTEFMVGVTGLRRPKRLLHYYGHLGTVVESRDGPKADCYFCKQIRGTGDQAEVRRYIGQLKHRASA